jgi:sortase (surface protein transpeptidase)
MHRRQGSARGPGGTSPALSALLAATVILAAALTLLWDAGAAQAAAQMRAEANGASTDEASARVEHEAPDPVAVRSDAVDIESPTIPLGKRDDGRLDVPDDAHTAGWWTGRANPGERGPAVIVGHVDSRDGPGAFWELADLEPGDRVTVDREDGTSVHWRVDVIEDHPKDDFPTEAVYGHTDEPTLRLVTCSGFFDPDTRSYDDNTIVFLTLDEEQDADPVGDVPDTEDGAVGDAALEPAGDLAEPTPRSRVPGDPLALEPQDDLGALAALAAEDDRRVPIVLAVLSILGAGGAVVRELAAER